MRNSPESNKIDKYQALVGNQTADKPKNTITDLNNPSQRKDDSSSEDNSSSDGDKFSLNSPKFINKPKSQKKITCMNIYALLKVDKNLRNRKTSTINYIKDFLDPESIHK